MTLIAERNVPVRRRLSSGAVDQDSRHRPYRTFAGDQRRFSAFWIGNRLAQCAVDVARVEKMGCLIAYMLPVNRGMQRVCEKLGFQLTYEHEPVIGRLDL